MLFILLSLTSLLCAETFTHIKPPKPGFYGVKIREDGEWEYFETEPPKPRLRALNHPPFWDFRGVTESVAIRTVKDQGQCGGCWAFASSDMAGAALYMNTDPHVDKTFSPQSLVDCQTTQTYGTAYTQGGCNGGYVIVAILDMIEKGIFEEACVPWNKDPGPGATCPNACTNSSAANKSKYKFTGYNFFDAVNRTLQTLRDLVTTSGPCVAEMKVYDDLSAWKKNDSNGGVYVSNKVGSFEPHAVVVYGFGKQNGKDYWLIKNSWGKNWPSGCNGNDCGYFKIKMGSNECGIESNFYSLIKNDDDYICPNCTVGGSGEALSQDTRCYTHLTSDACNGDNDCKWYLGGTIDGATKPPFCDGKNARCLDLPATSCFNAPYWGLTNCVVRSGKCLAPDDAGSTEDCQVYSTSSACGQKSGCYWYSSEDRKFCDLEKMNCSNLMTKDYCQSGVSWGLGCFWDGPKGDSSDAVNDPCSVLDAGACDSHPACYWPTSSTGLRKCEWGKCIDSPDCSGYATKELCTEVRGCVWESGAGETIGGFLDNIISTGSCVNSAYHRSVPVLAVALLMLLLAFLW